MGLQIEHYINSSGLQEMVEGSSIAHEFKHIYASHFMYDADGRAMWPAAAIDFTAKMQILYMINKGVENISDNKEINNYMAAEDRRIPFNHMIYFGDGLTDIPSMKLLRSRNTSHRRWIWWRGTSSISPAKPIIAKTRRYTTPLKLSLSTSNRWTILTRWK